MMNDVHASMQPKDSNQDIQVFIDVVTYSTELCLHVVIILFALWNELLARILQLLYKCSDVAQFTPSLNIGYLCEKWQNGYKKKQSKNCGFL